MVLAHCENTLRIFVVSTFLDPRYKEKYFTKACTIDLRKKNQNLQLRKKRKNPLMMTGPMFLSMKAVNQKKLHTVT